MLQYHDHRRVLGQRRAPRHQQPYCALHSVLLQPSSRGRYHPPAGQLGYGVGDLPRQHLACVLRVKIVLSRPESVERQVLLVEH